MPIKTAIAASQGQPIEIVDAILDEPKANEVLIKMVASGVCHTDVAGRDFGMAPYPVALGHEGAGIVEKVGEAVTTVKPGDHVVLSFTYCGHCVNCLAGHPANCVKLNELCFGGANYDGTHRIHSTDGEDISVWFGQSSFSTYCVADEHGIVKVDDDIDLGLVAPLGCGIQTGAGTVLNFLKPQFGESIVIFGAGAVGLSALMAAKILGMKHIIAVDVVNSRLELAKELGATEVVNGAKEDSVAFVRNILPLGIDYSVETTGVPSVVKQSFAVLKTAGTAALVGIAGTVTLDMMGEVIAEAKQVAGVIEGDAVPQIFIPQMIEYYKAGLFPIDKLEKFYDYSQLDEAFADSASGVTIKPVVRF
jgi:aryl-alcohol dehydrogenase